MRYALYYAPAAGSAVHAFGTAWLGRDADTGAALSGPAYGLKPERVRAATESPRRYGLHATLKAPFVPAPGCDLATLTAAGRSFARTCAPVTLPGLVLADIGGFLALVPREPSAALNELAERCVREFDRFRAATKPEEFARRAAGLSAHRRELLTNWGYPYVLDEWRFHITVTERLDAAERAAFARALHEPVASFANEPLAVDALTLVVEPAPGEPFRHAGRFAFGAAA